MSIIKCGFLLILIVLLSGCDNVEQGKFRVGNSVQKPLLVRMEYIPTTCVNGVWYYSAQLTHNTYFAPVFTKEGKVALCDGTQDQYVPERSTK